MRAAIQVAGICHQVVVAVDQVFIALPLEERKKALSDKGVREQLDKGANSEGAGILRALAKWENFTIAETFASSNKPFEGREVGELARQMGEAGYAKTMADYTWQVIGAKVHALYQDLVAGKR